MKYTKGDLTELYMVGRLTDKILEESDFKLIKTEDGGLQFVEKSQKITKFTENPLFSRKENRLLTSGISGRSLEFLLGKKSDFEDNKISGIKRVYYEGDVLEDRENPNAFPVTDFLVLLGSGGFKDISFIKCYSDTRTSNMEELYFSQTGNRKVFKYTFSEQGIPAIDSESLLNFRSLSFSQTGVKPNLLKMVRYLASEKFKVNVDEFMSLAETAVKYLEENFTLLVDVPVDRDYIGIDIFQDEDWFLYFDNFDDMRKDLERSLLSNPSKYYSFEQKYTLLTYFTGLPEFSEFVNELFIRNIQNLKIIPEVILNNSNMNSIVEDFYTEKFTLLEKEDSFIAVKPIAEIKTRLHYHLANVEKTQAKHYRQFLGKLRLESIQRMSDDNFEQLSKKPQDYNGLPEIREYVMERFKKQYNQELVNVLFQIKQEKTK